MIIEAFSNLDENRVAYLYLLTRMPYFTNKVSYFLKTGIINYNSQTATYTVSDAELEKYFKSIDAQHRSENIQKVDEYKSPYKELAIKLMELYPNGLKPNTVKYWRGNIFEVCNALETLSKITYFDTDLCIKATEEYIQSFNGDFTLMHILPYFILKPVVENGQTVYKSDLLSAIESVKNNESENKLPNIGWTTNLK